MSPYKINITIGKITHPSLTIYPFRRAHSVTLHRSFDGDFNSMELYIGSAYIRVDTVYFLAVFYANTVVTQSAFTYQEQYLSMKEALACFSRR